MPRNKKQEKKTANKYAEEITNCVLTRERFSRLGKDDRVRYIDRAVRKLHPTGRALNEQQVEDGLQPGVDGLRQIGGYFTCYWCGVADVFGGYVSEQD